MTRWKVGLSNGETYVEGKAPFNIVKGELSPWLKLKKFLVDTGFSITSLSLVNGNRTFNLPSAGNNPKFSFFSNSNKPTRFEFGTAYGMDDNGHPKDVFHVIEAEIPDVDAGFLYLQIWVSKINPANSWSLVSRTSIIKKRK